MRFLLRPVLALFFVCALGASRPISAVADGAAPSPPAPPASGWGSDKTPYAKAVEQVIANPAAPAHKVHLFRPAGAPAGAEMPKVLPVVLFAHGFGASNPEPYRAWIEHIAREGTLVVYPVYPALEAARPARYDVLWAGLEAGIAEFSAGGGVEPDTSRMGFVGHSFGGGAVPAIAARAAARGYGKEATWIECLAPWYDLDRAAWASLPPKALLLAVAFCDDQVCDASTAASFVKAATTIPAGQKSMVVFVSDAHGVPALKADHMTPLTWMGVDALDTWGTWRLDDALRTYALTGSPEAKAFAFGTDPAARSLGTWGDGAPMVPPAVGAVPPEARKGLRWASGGVAEEVGRSLGRAEPYSALPLPPPESAPASRLPLSERLCRPAPADVPLAAVAAVAKGPVLIVVAGNAKSATVAALDAASDALKAKGVAVVRVTPDSPLARDLDVGGDPSVLLYAKGGELRLWKEGEEPRLVPAILDLVK